MLQGTDNLPEFTIGGIKTIRYQTNEPYSGLETVIQLRHLYTTQVSRARPCWLKVNTQETPLVTVKKLKVHYWEARKLSCTPQAGNVRAEPRSCRRCTRIVHLIFQLDAQLAYVILGHLKKQHPLIIVFNHKTAGQYFSLICVYFIETVSKTYREKNGRGKKEVNVTIKTE